MNPLVVVRNTIDGDDLHKGVGLWVWCPGCDSAHRPQAVSKTDGTSPDGPVWEWNGATDETFTISPSFVTWTGDRNNLQPGDRVCHSYIKDGHWQFLSDCTHALVGQTVPMVPVPDWLVRE